MRLLRIPEVPAHPLSFWQKLHPHPQHGFFLGPAYSTSSALYMSAAEPARILNSDKPLRDWLARKPAGAAMPRFVGLFGFEAGRSFDPAINRLPQQTDALSFPRVCFGDYRHVVKIDLKKRETVVSSDNPALIARVKHLLSASSSGTQPMNGTAPRRFAVPSFSRFSKMVSSAKESIARGDIYQANLSLRFSAPYRESPFQLYERLSRRNPSAYACLLKIGAEWIVSTSPELLLRVQGRDVVTRPIAGTRPRGKNAAEDRRLRGQLLVSSKERAEHIMLVDLERNDLGRVCATGSVRVTERFAVERYSHVMHIVSEVRGRLMKNKNAFDALAALFPGGTITGCPKIRSIQIIQELEAVSRGPFYGSAGFFTWGGDAMFNILIRTALIRRARIYVQAGAGIVADSRPRREYQEVLAKARVLLESA